MTPQGTRTARLALAQKRWPELDDDRSTLVLVPVGSLEQHGPHLPLGTDTVVASAVVGAVAERLTAAGRRVVIGPPVSYGASGEHEGFPGTVSIGHDALHLLLVELGRSACRWAQGVVFVNGHGGNLPTVEQAVLLLRSEGRAVAWTGCGVPGGDAHAGHTETSVLRHLAPWMVRLDEAVVGVTEPVARLMPQLRRGGVRPVSPTGVLGDATRSSAEHGRQVLDAVVDRVHAELVSIDVDESGRLTRPAERPEPTRVPTAGTEDDQRRRVSPGR